MHPLTLGHAFTNSRSIIQQIIDIDLIYIMIQCNQNRDQQVKQA